MQRYRDRTEAGDILSDQLWAYKDLPDAIVLALPRGGVPVAYEVADTLNLPLDVFIVRKLGLPGHEELAMGAVAMGGITVFNEDVLFDIPVSKETMNKAILSEQAELKRRDETYRGKRKFPNLENKIVIIVDDGVATGATMRAAVQALRQMKPAKIIMAVPVAEKATSEKMAKLVDEFICPLVVTHFNAVGAWYEVFGQTSDEEVKDLLQKYRKR